MKIYQFVLVLFVIAISCKSPKESLSSKDIEFIKSKVWNLDISDFKKSPEMSDKEYYLSSSKFRHIPIFFIKGSMYVESVDESYDSCFFHQDTLLITHRYYISGSPARNVLDTIFLGKLVSLSNDTLKIARIKDKIFHFLLDEPNNYRILRFYNDSLITRNPTEFKIISLSTGLCYGTCPQQAIELDSYGNLFFFGGTFAYKQGYYKRHLNSSVVDSIKHLLTAALINQDALKLYGAPEDAQECEFKIIIANNDTIIIDGAPSTFNYRLWQIFSFLNKSVRTEKLISDTVPHGFLSTKYLDKYK